MQTAGSGLTLIQVTTAGEDVYAQYQVTSGTLSSVTMAFGTPQSYDFGVITDAVQPAPSSSSAQATVAFSPFHSIGVAVSEIASTLAAILLFGVGSVAYLAYAKAIPDYSWWKFRRND